MGGALVALIEVIRTFLIFGLLVDLEIVPLLALIIHSFHLVAPSDISYFTIKCKCNAEFQSQGTSQDKLGNKKVKVECYPVNHHNINRSFLQPPSSSHLLFLTYSSEFF